MNEFDGFTKPVFGGYHAYVRTASDGEAKPVLAKGGKPRVFTKEIDALRCAMESILRYINGHLCRDGEVAGRAKAEAMALFPGLAKQRGKTRSVVVESKQKRGRRHAR